MQDFETDLDIFSIAEDPSAGRTIVSTSFCKDYDSGYKTALANVVADYSMFPGTHRVLSFPFPSLSLFVTRILRVYYDFRILAAQDDCDPEVSSCGSESDYDGVDKEDALPGVDCGVGTFSLAVALSSLPYLNLY